MKPQFYRDIIGHGGILNERVYACCENHGLITSDDQVEELCWDKLEMVGFIVDSREKGLRLVLERKVIGHLLPETS